MDATKMKTVYVITERGERSYWTKIGVGMVNRDGSITLSLDALPANGNKLQVRDYVPKDADGPEAPDGRRRPAEAAADAAPY